MVIWEYHLKFTDVQDIEMPAGAEILSVATNPYGGLRLWALVDSEEYPYSRTIEIVPTDNPISTVWPLKRKFIGTAITSTSAWHVFERYTD